VTRVPNGRDRAAAVAVAAGAATVALGTVLPWLTLFAGLHRYPGVAGLYGRLLLLGAVAAGALAALALRDGRGPTRWLRLACALGVALLAASLWLLRNLFVTRDGLSAMVVPRAGPGLFVCALGALVLVAAGAVAAARRT
jgi:hypothetical protein